MQTNESIRRVQENLSENNFDGHVVFLPDSARTAQEAAKAIDCTVEQIAKSIVFQGKNSREPYLIIASGVNRINEKLIAQAVAEDVNMASANDVRDLTGFVIGGVAPVGHTQSLKIFIDEDLLNHETIWAAAGHPKAVFELTPDDLQTLTKGNVVQVS